MVSTVQMVLCLKLVSLETDSEVAIYMQKILEGSGLWNSIFKKVRVAGLGRRGN